LHPYSSTISSGVLHWLTTTFKFNEVMLIYYFNHIFAGKKTLSY
jgi:hypothetical protein